MRTQKSALIWITPSEATAMLENIDNPRSATGAGSLRKIDTISRDILSGNWTLNGATILINSKGALVDGQHRLHAIIKAGKRVKTWVVYGVDDVRYIDLGGNMRTWAQLAQHGGIKNASAVQAVARRLYSWLKSVDRCVQTTITYRPSIAELDEVLERYPKIVESVDRCLPARDLVSPAKLAFIHLVGGMVDAAKAEEFVQGVILGENLARKDSRLLVRNRLMKSRNEGARASEDVTLEILVRGWNNYLQGNTVTSVPVIGPPLPPIWFPTGHEHAVARSKEVRRARKNRALTEKKKGRGRKS